MQFLNVLLYILLAFTSVFLICLVLIQRGKGGGLAGAFGAQGGSSAFGTKAGDVFTRVTMIVAGIWIALNMLLVILSNRPTSAYGDTPAGKSSFTPSKPADGKTSLPTEGLDKGTNAPPSKAEPLPPPAPVSGTSPIAPNTPVTPVPAPKP